MSAATLKRKRAKFSHYDQIRKHYCGDICRKINSRCAPKHDWIQTHRNRACQSDTAQGSTEQCFTANLWEAVKWGAFNLISTRLIWPQCHAETPAGVRVKLIGKSRRPIVTWSEHPPPLRVHYALHHKLLCSSIIEMQSINHGEYYSDHLVL